MDIFKIVFVLIIVAVIIWQAIKRSRALRDPISDNECVSCGSTSVTMLGPNAYRCDQCGYEGGSGVAAKRAQDQLDWIAQMDPALRQESGVKDLHEARTLLLSTLGSGVTIGESGAAIGTAQSNLAQAKQHLQQASLKLGDSYLALQPEGGNPSAMVGAEVATAVDAQMIAGGVVESLVAMGSLEGMKAEAQSLLQRAEAAITHYTGQPPQA